jgi:small subunit ribosomal protein S14
MASKRMIRREAKREKLQRLSAKRQQFRKLLNDPTIGLEEKFAILTKLEAMPKDSSRIRLSRRCRLNGRARGVYRKFGICRNEIRKKAMQGEIPGLVMASW